ncbi:hypothetical protein [Methanobrevibacter sp.]|uniref:hypothetical protein n=1 Tax=Methanobrevibacter sp. TaxID=66852 RepID=UPI00257F1A1B|nr:hypothetical protein [Methanobrevibacter sp.]MBR2665835.1 hypothetical protein [Methanobrevibacter sp.]
MKLKKSNILLIVIAIFLLMSIGSVCASENITDNGDIDIADDGTNVVLSDTDDNVADDSNQEKTNTTIETEKEKYEFKQDSNKNFSVTVKDNKTGNPIDVNKSDLTVSNGNKSISFDYASSIITITEVLPVGNYNLTINYLGNEIYFNSTKVIGVGIYGNNTIETVTSVVCNGKDIEIPVTINNGLENITNLIKDNFNLTLVYTNETGNVSNMSITDFNIENGKIKFTTNVAFIAANLTIDYVNATEPKTVSIKISTEVQANVSKDKFESEEIKNISIEIKDGQGNLLNISKNDLKVFDNGNEITNFNYNNSNITLDLDVGVHNITIVYKGNVTYNESKTQVVMKVYGNHTLEVPEVVVSNGTTVEIPIKLTDGVDDFTSLLNSSNTNVTLKYNETNVTVDVDWTPVKDTHKFDFTINRIVPTTLVINYTDENGKSIIKNVAIKFSTQVQINPETVNITEGENATFIVTVIGADGSQINITKGNLTITKSVANNKFNETTGNLTLIGLTRGVYNLTITFKGNDLNNTSKANVIINVRGAPEIITNGTSINVNSTRKGEIQIINITNGVDTLDFTKDDLNLTVTYKDGNETKNITIEWNLVNGTVAFTLENANFTTANLTITYNETSIKNITLNRIYNVIIEAVNTVNEYHDGNFTFKVTDVDDNTTSLKGKTLSLLLKGNISVGHSTTIDENNIGSYKTANLYIFDQSGGGLSMKQLEVGNYTVEMSVSGALKATKLTTNITVKKANIKIEIAPYKEYYGSDKNITITVTNANSGLAVPGIILRLDMPQTSGKTYYLQTNSDGVGRISAKGLIGGDYDLTVSNNDTKNMNNASTKTTVTVMKIPVKIAASGLTVYYNTGATATIKVTKDGKPVSGMYLLVRLYTTSTKYNDYLFQTNDKGQVSFSASLTVGKHKMIINSADNRYGASQVTKTITVKKASAKITAKKVTDYYKGAKYFTVKLTNTKNNKPIYVAKLNIKVFVSKNRYYNYNGHTGANGEIRLSLETLKPGTYKVVVAGADSKDFTAKEVTSKIVIKKAPAKLTPKKLTAKKGAKKYFKVTVKNKKTKKVIKGVKVKIKVYTGKKAKTFTAKTNAKGIAKILTNKLKVGKHKVVVASADKYVTAKKAKSTIKITK